MSREVKDAQKQENINENVEEKEPVEGDVVGKEKNDADDKEQQFEDLGHKLAEINDKYLRLSAEFDNYRKRTLKEKMELMKNAVSIL